MMKTIKGTAAAGKTTKLIEMLNELEGKTLLIQNEMTSQDLEEMNYIGDLYTTNGVSVNALNESFVEIKPFLNEYSNIGVDLMGVHGEAKEVLLEAIQQLAKETNINFIMTEQVECKGEKYLEVA